MHPRTDVADPALARRHRRIGPRDAQRHRRVVRRQARPDARPRLESMFPRYLFVQLQSGLQDWAPIRSTRGAIGLVRRGEQPAVVPDSVIDFLEDFNYGTAIQTDSSRAAFDPEYLKVAGDQLPALTARV